MAKPKAVHIMVDLETLDTAPTAHVLSAAVVPFDPQTGKPEWLQVPNYYQHEVLNISKRKADSINFGLAEQQGATANPSTIKWWTNTNNDYFQSLLNVQRADIAFHEFLSGFNAAIHQLVQLEERDVCIWCTGSFDLDILKNASERHGIKWVVPYFAYKDVRVCRQIAEDLNLLPGDEDATHNAYEDCLRQIKYVSAVYGAINK